MFCARGLLEPKRAAIEAALARERRLLAPDGLRGRRATIPRLTTSVSGAALLLALVLVDVRGLLAPAFLRVVLAAALRVEVFFGAAAFLAAVFDVARLVAGFFAALGFVERLVAFDAVRAVLLAVALRVVVFFAVTLRVVVFFAAVLLAVARFAGVLAFVVFLAAAFVAVRLLAVRAVDLLAVLSLV